MLYDIYVYMYVFIYKLYTYCLIYQHCFYFCILVLLF